MWLWTEKWWKTKYEKKTTDNYKGVYNISVKGTSIKIYFKTESGKSFQALIDRFSDNLDITMD